MRLFHMQQSVCRLFGVLGLLACTALRAAGGAEQKAYQVALRSFDGVVFNLAEKEFAEFIKNYPASDKVPEAVLLQAQCRYQLKRYDDALSLLRERLVNAGKLADQYRYWIPECLFQKGDYAGAAAAFAGMLSEFPDSSRRLEASLGEAYARFKLGDLQRTVELLGPQEGAFQQAAQKQTDADLVIRGRLLLGEAYLGLKKFREGEEEMTRLGDRKLAPELSWERLYLLARLQLAGQELDSALHTTTNLLGQLATVTNAASLHWQADTAALRGEIFEQKGRTESAILAYEGNLRTNAPPARRQQALQQIVKLTLAQQKVGEAARRLEAFVVQNPQDSGLDTLRLTLGEMRLKEYYELPEEPRGNASNLLQQAKAQFGQIIANTNSPLGARAQLGLGWCLWEEGQAGRDTNRIADSLLAFRTAAEQLTRSKEQAVARFKLADCQFNLRNYAGALMNYWQVATNYADLPEVQNGWVGHALYQIVRASIQLDNLASADQAVQKILADYPPGDLNDRSLLLYGQALGRLASPARARDFFARFIDRFPQSSMLPEVELAVVRTRELEGDWENAAGLYDDWIAKHADHASRPNAEFNRAWASDLAGNESNAFRLFTNFVAQFPTHQFAPQAQYWIATYYFRRGGGGTNYVNAEENYQKVFQNTKWSPSELSFQAQMMAGRSAYARQGYSDATNYFTRLINELKKLNSPSPLLPEAYYALADTYVRYPEAVPDSINTLENYKEAIVVLGKIPVEFPTNALAPLAWGQMGAYYSQLAGQTRDAKDYERAVKAYTLALNSDLADVTCRSLAQVGLAKVLERQAQEARDAERTNLLDQAFGHYWQVVEGKNLREQEVADPFWVKAAAIAAARLAEELRQWDVAAKLYERLRDELAPTLRKTWQLKLEKLAPLRSHIESAKN